jgi:hypothetical protein
MFATLAPSSTAAQRRWRVRPGQPALSPSLVWRAVLAALAMLALLLAFQQVLRQAVAQGEQRRRANAVLADATWRCNIQRDRQRRESCLAQLTSVPRDNASLPALRVAVAASAATSAR